MTEDHDILDPLHFRIAANAELDHIRSLGSKNLMLATANLGAYEALLCILSSGEPGMPVYQVVTNVKSSFSSQSGILVRLKIMRQAGLIEEFSGPKKSQVCLAASQKLMRELGPLLVKRLNSSPKGG